MLSTYTDAELQSIALQVPRYVNPEASRTTLMNAIMKYEYKEYACLSLPESADSVFFLSCSRDARITKIVNDHFKLSGPTNILHNTWFPHKAAFRKAIYERSEAEFNAIKDCDKEIREYFTIDFDAIEEEEEFAIHSYPGVPESKMSVQDTEASLLCSLLDDHKLLTVNESHAKLLVANGNHLLCQNPLNPLKSFLSHLLFLQVCRCRYFTRVLET